MGGSEADILSVGDTFHDRYEVLRQIGAGGMGAVYEVMDVNTKRHRALKVMLPRLVEEKELRRRFRAEATVAAVIDSEHIAEVLDAGIDDDTNAPFIVLELLKGEELADLVEQRGPMSPQEVGFYLTQAASALDKAHAAGVVHRDLKPENLYVTYRDDGTPRIKILDFGIAKVVTSTLNKTQTTGLLGTPAYMATEQIDGDIPISGRTDGYAVGHIAYTLLVGQPYWSDELKSARSLLHLISRIVKGPQESASKRALRAKVTLPTGFDGWFAKATAPMPEDRFETVGESIEALTQVFQLSTVSWVPPEPREPSSAEASRLPANETVTINPQVEKQASASEVTTASPGASEPPASSVTPSPDAGSSTSHSSGVRASTGVPVSATIDPTSAELPKNRRWPLVMGLAAMVTVGVGAAYIPFEGPEQAVAPAAAPSEAPDEDATPPGLPSDESIADVAPGAADPSSSSSGDAPKADAPKPESPKPVALKPASPKPASPKPAAPKPAPPKPAPPKPASPKPAPGEIDLVVPTR